MPHLQNKGDSQNKNFLAERDQSKNQRVDYDVFQKQLNLSFQNKNAIITDVLELKDVLLSSSEKNQATELEACTHGGCCHLKG